MAKVTIYKLEGSGVRELSVEGVDSREFLAYKDAYFRSEEEAIKKIKKRKRSE